MRFATIAASLLGLAACAQRLPPAPVALDPAAHATALLSMSLDAPPVRQALAAHGLTQPPGGAWTIDALTLAAWTLRADVAVARADITTGKAAERVAAERPNPTLSISPDTIIGAPAGVIPWTLGLAASFVSEPGGKRALRTSRAQADTAIRLARLGEVMWSVRSDVRLAAIAVRTTQVQQADATALQALQRSYDRWVAKQVDAGLLSRTERRLSQSDIIASDVAVAQARASRGAAEQQLRRAVGITDPAVAIALEPPEAAEVLPLAGLQALVASAVANRLDVARALAEYAAAEIDVRSEAAKRQPDVSYGPVATYDKGDKRIGLNLSAVLPLFHNADASIALAVAQRDSAAQRFYAVQAAAAGDAQAAAQRYATAADLRQQTARAVQAQQAGLDAASRRLAAGVANRGEVLAAQISLHQRASAQHESERMLMEAIGALETAIQRPLWPTSALTSAATESVQ